MTDSTPLLTDPAALSRRFEQDGFLLLRGLLGQPQVDALRKDVGRALASSGDWLAAGSDPEDTLPGPIVIREGDENWWGGYTEVQRLESFHALAHDSRLLAVAALLIPDEVLVHPRKIARITYPKSAHPTPPHQDFPALQGTADIYTMWLPLVDCSRQMGALQVLRGSHRDGLRPVIQQPGVGGFGVDVAYDDPALFTTDYRQGDVLLFHSFTVHVAPPNDSDRMRLSVDYRYQSAREPIGSTSLDPHGFPHCPGWAELTGDWSSTSHIAVPAGVTVAEFQNPFEELDQPRSRHLQGSGAGPA